MKTPFRLLIIVLILLLVFYSLFYYAHYHTRNPSIIKDVRQLAKTDIIIDPGARADSSNLFYSPGTLLAFNQLIDSLSISQNDPVNHHEKLSGLPAVYLDGTYPNNHLAFWAGRYNPHTPQLISRLLESKLNLSNSVEIKGTGGEYYIFNHVHEEFMIREGFKFSPHPITFGDKKVKALEGVFAPARKKFLSVFSIPDPQKKSFITKIVSKKSARVLVLARINPELTLWNTYQKVEHLIHSEKFREDTGNLLIRFPVISVKLEKFDSDHYLPKEDTRKHSANPLSVQQVVSLDINAQYSLFDNNAKSKSDQTQTRIYNRPFLLYFKEKGQPPELIAWIANPGILHPAKNESN